MNRTDPTDPLSRIMIARNMRHNREMDEECEMVNGEAGASYELPGNRSNSDKGVERFFHPDDAAYCRRQTERVKLRGGERKPTPKQIVGRTIAYLLLFVAAYFALRAF